MLNCPLMEKQIDEGICFDIHMVVERVAPKWTAPEEATRKTNYEDICLNCPNHRDD